MKGISDERRIAEERVIQALEKRNFELAIKTMLNYEAKNESHRNMLGQKVKDYLPALVELFDSYPEFLHSISKEKVDKLKVLVGSAFLWGKRAKIPKEWGDLSERFENKALVNMLMNYSLHKKSLSNYKANSDVVKAVQILTCQDACEECKKFAGRTFLLSGKIPELPNPLCTCKNGCRCTYTPVTIGSKSLREAE